VWRFTFDVFTKLFFTSALCLLPVLLPCPAAKRDPAATSRVLTKFLKFKLDFPRFVSYYLVNIVTPVLYVHLYGLFYKQKEKAMRPLTDKQKTVLRIIAEKVKEVGYPPTLQELADELGVRSKNAVLKHLNALEKKGYIGKREGGAARGIRILESLGFLDTTDVDSLPLVGSVPAGSPLLAEENVERYVSIPKELLPTKGEYFALKVQGDSMIDAGIFEDDLVVVHSTNSAYNGDIVVALIGNETTVKRFVLKNGEPYLKPENPSYPEIHPAQEWSVQGKVVALIRESVN
jgi:repressor LexA